LSHPLYSNPPRVILVTSKSDEILLGINLNSDLPSNPIRNFNDLELVLPQALPQHLLQLIQLQQSQQQQPQQFLLRKPSEIFSSLRTIGDFAERVHISNSRVATCLEIVPDHHVSSQVQKITPEIRDPNSKSLSTITIPRTEVFPRIFWDTCRSGQYNSNQLFFRGVYTAYPEFVKLLLQQGLMIAVKAPPELVFSQIPGKGEKFLLESRDKFLVWRRLLMSLGGIFYHWAHTYQPFAHISGANDVRSFSQNS